MTRLAAVDDDRMLLLGMQAWLTQHALDVELVMIASTVTDLLRCRPTADVILLDLRLRDGSEATENVARLVQAGYRVLVVSSHHDKLAAIGVTKAGADGYITKDHELATLADAVRQVARGESAFSPEWAFALARDCRPDRPALSPQERSLLVAYASGLTLTAAARSVGIRPGTAKGYLDRIKDKYQAAGRPAYTKLELADRVREDGLRG